MYQAFEPRRMNKQAEKVKKARTQRISLARYNVVMRLNSSYKT
jgi:hypothetical protein